MRPWNGRPQKTASRQSIKLPNTVSRLEEEQMPVTALMMATINCHLLLLLSRLCQQPLPQQRRRRRHHRPAQAVRRAHARQRAILNPPLMTMTGVVNVSATSDGDALQQNSIVMQCDTVISKMFNKLHVTYVNANRRRAAWPGTMVGADGANTSGPTSGSWATLTTSLLDSSPNNHRTSRQCASTSLTLTVKNEHRRKLQPLARRRRRQKDGRRRRTLTTKLIPPTRRNILIAVASYDHKRSGKAQRTPTTSTMR